MKVSKLKKLKYRIYNKKKLKFNKIWKNKIKNCKKKNYKISKK